MRCVRRPRRTRYRHAVAPNSAGASLPSGSHLYSIPGLYTSTTTATDDDGGVVQAVRLVTIEDLAPVIAPANFGSALAGALFVRSGSFTDLTGPEDSWTATVRYDDGAFLPLSLNPNGSFTLQNVFLIAGVHSVTVTVADNFGKRDTKAFAVDVQSVPAPPTILGIALNGGFSQRSWLAGLTVQFSSNVGASVSASDFVLRNLTTSTDVAPASLTFSYNRATNALTIAPAVGVILPAGNYHLTVLAAGITDSLGQPLSANGLLDFHLLTGDANGDRVVNDLDLYLVWRNLLLPAANRDAQFDLNRDGSVTAADLDLIRANYRNTVAAPSSARALAALNENLSDGSSSTGSAVMRPEAISAESALLPTSGNALRANPENPASPTQSTQAPEAPRAADRSQGKPAQATPLAHPNGLGWSTGSPTGVDAKKAEERFPRALSRDFDPRPASSLRTLETSSRERQLWRMTEGSHDLLAASDRGLHGRLRTSDSRLLALPTDSGSSLESFGGLEELTRDILPRALQSKARFRK